MNQRDSHRDVHDALDLFFELESRGVSVRVEGDRLHYKAHGVPLTPDFLGRLKINKPMLLQLLSRSEREGDSPLAPNFRSMPACKAIPSFRWSTWRAARDGTTAVESTNRRSVVRVRLPLVEEQVDGAVAALTHRYPILNSHFEQVGGRPVLIPGEGVTSRVVFHDLTGGNDVEREEQTTRLVSEILWTPFDLFRGPLFRPFWIKQDHRAHVIGFAVHHLISDAISCGVLLQDLCGHLWPQLSDRSKAAGGSALGYEDYLLAMDEWMRQPVSTALLERYAAQMIRAESAALPALTMATNLKTESVALDESVVSRLRLVAKKLSTSSFCVLLAALIQVFKQASKQDQIVFGRVIPGREFGGFRRSVGYFADRVFGSVDLSGNPGNADIIARTAEAVAASSRFEFIRSDFLMHRLNELGRPSATPVINFRTDITPRLIGGSRQQPGLLERFEMSPPPRPALRSDEYLPIWLSLVDQGTRITGFVNHGLASPLPFVDQFERALEQLTRE